MFSPASDRNKTPIADVLRNRLPPKGRLLELACGSQQHACHIAPEHPYILWQPTDIDPAALSWGATLDTPDNVAGVCRLDVTELPWALTDTFDAIYTANLLHISPEIVGPALFRGARQCLNPNGQIFVYGPFSIDGQHTSEGNKRFDASLRQQNSAWGIRDLSAVTGSALDNGFLLHECISMPANNLMLVFSS